MRERLLAHVRHAIVSYVGLCLTLYLGLALVDVGHVAVGAIIVVLTFGLGVVWVVWVLVGIVLLTRSLRL